MAEVTGFDELFRKLSDVQTDIKTKASIAALDKAARKVKASAKQLCPVDTGRLRNSVQSDAVLEGSEVVGIVYTNVEYAPYVEYGTGQTGESTTEERPEGVSFRHDWGGQQAQPYMYPALRQNKDNIEKIIANEIKKFIGD